MVNVSHRERDRSNFDDEDLGRGGQSLSFHQNQFYVAQSCTLFSLRATTIVRLDKHSCLTEQSASDGQRKIVLVDNDMLRSYAVCDSSAVNGSKIQKIQNSTHFFCVLEHIHFEALLIN